MGDLCGVLYLRATFFEFVGISFYGTGWVSDRFHVVVLACCVFFDDFCNVIEVSCIDESAIAKPSDLLDEVK